MLGETLQACELGNLKKRAMTAPDKKAVRIKERLSN